MTDTSKLTGLKLTGQSPFPRRFYAYLKERFPLFNHGILIISYYSSNQFLAQVLEETGDTIHYSPYSIMGGITLFCMFFHLRIFDEHKDYEDDCQYYPDRLLSKGWITLTHLKYFGAAAILIELILSFISGTPAFIAGLLAIGFSILMLKEFFISKWLKDHFLIYALSHMLIMPLFALVVYSFTTNKYPWEAPGWFWVYAFVGFFVTTNWEISRKIRAPEDEIDGVDTYSKIFGSYGAAYLVVFVRIIDTGMVFFVGYHIGLSVWFYIVLILLFLMTLVGLLQFRFNTSAKTAKRMETYAGLYIIAFDLTLAIEIIRAYPFSFF